MIRKCANRSTFPWSHVCSVCSFALKYKTYLFCASRAFEIVKNRGQRSWSVGLSIADVTNSVLTDKKKTHSVSTLAQVEVSSIKKRRIMLIFICYLFLAPVSLMLGVNCWC